VPASALMFRDSGLQVAILDADHHVRFVPVTIARDFGTTVELASGLQASDQVINNPPDVLQAGDAVKVSAGPSPGASGAHAPP
jgi:multidrug efflux system membrane fusion protein